MRVRRIIATWIAATAFAVAVVPAAGADDTTDVTVTGGSLTITNPLVANFAGVTLDGTVQTTTATMDNFSVTDARGTGAGWNVTVQATQLAEWNGTQFVPGGKVFLRNSLSMPAPTVTKADATSSGLPTVTTPPGPAGYKIDGVAAVKIASAATNDGMGSYNFTQGGPLSVNVLASAFARTYRSTVTVSVVDGP